MFFFADNNSYFLQILLICSIACIFNTLRTLNNNDNTHKSETQQVVQLDKRTLTHDVLRQNGVSPKLIKYVKIVKYTFFVAMRCYVFQL